MSEFPRFGLDTKGVRYNNVNITNKELASYMMDEESFVLIQLLNH